MICEEKIKQSYLGILDLSTTCKSWAIPYSWVVFFGAVLIYLLACYEADFGKDL